MSISVFDIYSVGIGPSSSHTLGPMRAVTAFVADLTAKQQLPRVQRITVDLYGSLALTGQAHGTHKAVMLGLDGHHPETVESAQIAGILARVTTDQQVSLTPKMVLAFDPGRDIIEHKDRALDKHANAMTVTAFAGDEILHQETYYSIGGGFVVTDAEFGHTQEESLNLPYAFKTADQLWAHAREQNVSIADIVRANERVWRSADEITQRLNFLADEMFACIARGCAASGELPGGLRVRRRAPELHQRLANTPPSQLNHEQVLCWLNMCAMAVNEENAAGNKVITSPTNGAAGIIPTVLNYVRHFTSHDNQKAYQDFLLTAAAIGILYKQQASISGAEMGCQGEVGVACSMAAGALAAVMGGTLEQVENAAEIGMEHNLGLTCDPVAGLVQIPCIERNAMGSVKAVNAAYLALAGDGQHKVSLDKVIETMRQTGRDMMSIYKETSLGGLAATVNIPDC